MIDATGRTVGGGDAFAAIWQARVHLRFPDGQFRQVADYLATAARRPGTAIVEFDAYTVHRLLLSARLRPDGLRQLLAGLADAGMLTRVHDHDSGTSCFCTLTMPPPHPIAGARRPSLVADPPRGRRHADTDPTEPDDGSITQASGGSAA